MVGEIEKLYPADVEHSQCVLQRTQYAWRIGKNGKAVYVRYEMYNLPGSEQCTLPPGLRNSRSEYGFEIGLLVAYLHYWIGVSLDHACAIIQFFTDLDLSKSQANSLLNQLSEDWSAQEEAIAELIVLQLIVYIDETGWKVGMKSCYTWVFTTSLYVLYRCGVSREKEIGVSRIVSYDDKCVRYYYRSHRTKAREYETIDAETFIDRMGAFPKSR